jgi:hypothetical protein
MVHGFGEKPVKNPSDECESGGGRRNQEKSSQTAPYDISKTTKV